MLVDENGLPVLAQYSEEGFVDCVFRIDGLEADDSYYYFNMLASHEDEPVGLAVRLVKHVEPGFDSNMELIGEHVYRNGVLFRSLGSISDRLIDGLARLYGLEGVIASMIPEEAFTAIALHQKDTDLARHTVKLKLFGRDQEPFIEDDYYESFFNVDLVGGLVWWNEKDSDYRLPLIRALSAA